MKHYSLKTEWVLWLVCIFPVLFLFLSWEVIPETIALHYGINGEPDRWGSKNVLLWIIPVLNLFMYILLFFIPLIDPKQRISGMGKSKYFMLRLIILSIISLLLSALIFTSIKYSFLFMDIINPLLGILLILLGNYFQTVKPNYFIGIRTPWSLHNDLNWQKTHKFGGRTYIFGGILLLMLWYFYREDSANSFFLIGLIIVLFIPVLYSFFLYKNQKTDI